MPGRTPCSFAARKARSEFAPGFLFVWDAEGLQNERLYWTTNVFPRCTPMLTPCGSSNVFQR